MDRSGGAPCQNWHFSHCPRDTSRGGTSSRAYWLGKEGTYWESGQCHQFCSPQAVWPSGRCLVLAATRTDLKKCRSGSTPTFKGIQTASLLILLTALSLTKLCKCIYLVKGICLFTIFL